MASNERNLAEAHTIRAAYEQALKELSSINLSRETVSTLEKVDIYLIDKERSLLCGGPSRSEWCFRDSFVVSSYKDCYLFFDSSEVKADDLPIRPFFVVEKAKLRPGQIEFLDAKCTNATESFK